MKKVVLLLILCLPLLINAQKELPEISDKYWYDSLHAGKAKCMEISSKILSYGEGILTKDEKEEFQNRECDKYMYHYHKFLFDKNGNLTLSMRMDSTNTFSYNTSAYIFDSLNRLIENDVFNNRFGKRVFRNKYEYDSSNNCTSQKNCLGDYDSLINEYHISYYNNKLIGIGNFGIDSKVPLMFKDTKKVEEYNNDNSILNTQVYSIRTNELLRSIYETNKGNKKVKTESEYIYNNKVNIKPLKNTTTTYTKKNKTFYKYEMQGYSLEKDAVLNEHKDLIKEDIYRYRYYHHPNSYTRFHVTKTFKYEYDSHGNYTKKIIFKDNIPLAEIDREIEYYE